MTDPNFNLADYTGPLGKPKAPFETSPLIQEQLDTLAATMKAVDPVQYAMAGFGRRDILRTSALGPSAEAIAEENARLKAENLELIAGERFGCSVDGRLCALHLERNHLKAQNQELRLQRDSLQAKYDQAERERAALQTRIDVFERDFKAAFQKTNERS